MATTVLQVTAIRVTGCAGSGKSRLARTLADGLGMRYVELDALHLARKWRVVPTAQFRAAVAAELSAAGARGVVLDGNYLTTLEGLTDGLAGLRIALDLPRPLVFAQLLRRTASRLVRGTVLFNGNRERWSSVISRDPSRNLLLWAHRNFARYHREAVAAQAAAAAGGPPAIRLTSRRQIRTFEKWALTGGLEVVGASRLPLAAVSGAPS
jgi:adenylate kinase family enzyme